jgi:hypothetical protein
MSLYPEGHQPFESRGLCLDQITADGIQTIADERNLDKHGHDFLYLFGELSRLANRLPAQITTTAKRN